MRETCTGPTMTTFRTDDVVIPGEVCESQQVGTKWRACRGQRCRVVKVSGEFLSVRRGEGETAVTVWVRAADCTRPVARHDPMRGMETRAAS